MSSLQLPMVFATFFLQFLSRVYSSTFTTRNKCSYPVWPEILSGAGTTFARPCKFQRPGNFPCSCNFPCLTEDNGYSTMASSGGGAAPPATLVEFTFNGAGGLDFYDVSFVDPMMVAQHGGTGYAANFNEDCPVELKIIDGNNEGAVGKSGSNAFRDPRYCCGGACTSPDTCKPSSCSEFFKNACPQACSHSYDDGTTSTFTCVGADDIITFCPDLCTRLILIASAAEKTPAPTRNSLLKQSPSLLKQNPAPTRNPLLKQSLSLLKLSPVATLFMSFLATAGCLVNYQILMSILHHQPQTRRAGIWRRKTRQALLRQVPSNPSMNKLGVAISSTGFKALC